MNYRILIEQDEDGVFVAKCPSLSGCISQGNTRSEVIENSKDAIKGYIESLRKHGEPVPPFMKRLSRFSFDETACPFRDKNSAGYSILSGMKSTTRQAVTQYYATKIIPTVE